MDRINDNFQQLGTIILQLFEKIRSRVKSVKLQDYDYGQIALVTIVYFLAARFGLSLANATEQVTTIWPPTGIALAAFLIVGYRIWPGIILGAFFANLFQNEPVFVAAGIGATNTLASFLGAYVLNQFINFRTTLDRLVDALGLILIPALAGSAISASLGVLNLATAGLAQWSNFGSVWTVWWVGDIMGVIIVAPLLLTILNWRRVIQDLKHKLIEFSALLILTSLVSIFVFITNTSGTGNLPVAYLIFPFMIWAAMRFTQVGAATINFLVASIAVIGTISHRGPFASTALLEQNLVFLHVYMFVFTATSLILAAVITERRQAKEAEERAKRQALEADAHLKSIIDNSHDAIISKDLDGNIVSWNQGAKRIYGYEFSEVLGKHISILVPSDKPDEIPHILKKIENGEFVDHFETTRIKKDGKQIDVSLTVSPIKDNYGEIVGVSTIARDITEQKEIAKKVETSDRRLKYVIESVSDGFATFDFDWKFTFVNSKAAEFLRTKPEDLIGKSAAQLYSNAKLAMEPERFMSELEQKKPVKTEIYYNDFKTWFFTKFYPTKEGYAVYFQDITESKLVNEEMQRAKERLELAQQVGKIGTFEWNIKTNEVIWTPELEALYGFAPGGFGGKFESWQARVHPDDLVSANSEIIRAAQLGHDLDTQFRIILPDKTTHWIKAKARVYKDERGVPAKMIGINVDISDEKNFEERIKYHFYHDNLTGLPNRVYFSEKIHHAVTQPENSGEMLAVMILDLDRFKNINDSLGHAIGDRLIQEVSLRLTNCLSDDDILARLGGDEFTMMLPKIQREEEAAKICQKILESLRHPFFLDGNELYITPSIGISLFPYDGKDVSSLMKNADSALYRAKEQGRNNYQFYTPSMNATAFQQLTLESTLRRALDSKEFVLYYQPQIDVRTSRICSAEALIRWQHPEKGLTFPDEFIGIAETTGLIEPIGEWVIRQACIQGKKWHDKDYKITVAVNISTRQFKQKKLTDIIRNILNETGFDPHYLEIELTESILSEDLEGALAILNELKQMGVKLALDDFSTGYSSLNYIKHFPFDVLKIDKSFVRGIPREQGDSAIANSIITLGHSLGMQVVAEGVEKFEQANHLRKRNCDKMQGYLFSGPVPVEAFQSLLERDGIGIRKMA